MLARLANHWADEQHDVTVVTLADVSQDDFQLSSEVRRVALRLTGDSRGVIGAFRENLRRVAALRQVLREARPHVVVSFIEQANVLALLAGRPFCIPVVISERTDPSRHRAGRIWEFLRRRVYHRCAALVVLTEEIAEQMRPILRGRPIVVIPNGIGPPAVPRVPEEQRSERTVLAIGRLSPEKGFDRLIKAFRYQAQTLDRFPPWRLVILGEGPERSRLCGIARSCPQGSVALPGRVDDSASWLARADLFALPSRYEGFPNALLEAMAAGVPGVAFDCSPAVRQIIRPGIDGLLVPEPDDPKGDVANFVGALGELMTDADRRRRMGEAAREVTNRFSLEDFFRRWDEVIAVAAQ